MKKIENYFLQTLDQKHSEDCIHGYDPVYEASFDAIKKIVNDAKQYGGYKIPHPPIKTFTPYLSTEVSEIIEFLFFSHS